MTTILKKQQQQLINAYASDFTYNKEDRIYEIHVSDIKEDTVRRDSDRTMKSTVKTMSSSRLIDMVGVREELDADNNVIARHVDDLIIITFDVELDNNPKQRRKDIIRYSAKFKDMLKRGVRIVFEDGTEKVFVRVIRSASQTRVGKAYFIEKSRKQEILMNSSYRALFLAHEGAVNIAKLQARLGLATSNSLRFAKEMKITDFAVIPDHTVERTFNTIFVGSEEVEGQKQLVVTDAKKHKHKLSYADGQGTALPSYFALVAASLGYISGSELVTINLVLSQYNEDIFTIYNEVKDEAFWLAFNKVPQAMQIRFGMVKGLLFMFPHNLPQFRQDCRKKKSRKDGLIMEFMELAGMLNENGEYEYNFDAPILFTDSMWKENIDPASFENEDKDLRPHMEIVLLAGKEKTKTFMGYQFWNALGDDIDIASISEEVITGLKETIFTNPKDALEFLGAFTTNDELGSDEVTEDDEINSTVDKLKAVLTLSPLMIADRWVQQSLRKVITRFVERMRDDARIPVAGANPYIIADPFPMFGLKPVLKKGQYYYNGRTGKAAGFRSPLVDESEAVVLNLTDVDAFHGLFKNILVFNWYDDTLTRMGGADTDGDKIALVFNETIIAHVKGNKLPLITDMGGDAQKAVMTDENIAQYDLMTILPEADGGGKVYSIGEITNYGTIWSDIAKSPRMLKMLGITKEEALHNVQILRGMQGITIDFAKTGINVPMDEELLIFMQPAWKKGQAIKKDILNKDKEIVVYVSESPIQKNWDYMNEVLLDMETFTTPAFDNNGYSFKKTIENSEIIDMDEFDELVDVISDIEEKYRKAMGQAGAFEDTEDRLNHIAYVTEMYTTIVETLPYTPAAISAAAYNVCYTESKSRGKSVSFVWNCCFPGILQLLETSGHSIALFPIPSKVAIDRVPETVTVKDNQVVINYTDAEGQAKQYKFKVVTANGEYNVHNTGTRAFIEVKPRKTAEQRIQAMKARRAEYIGRTVHVKMVGFRYTDFTTAEFVEALNENQGVITIVDGERNKGKASLNVMINGNRYGIINEAFISDIKPFLDGETQFNVLNYGDIKGTYVKTDRKTNEVLDKAANHVALEFAVSLIGDIPEHSEEEEVIAPKKTKKSQPSDDAYYPEPPPADYGYDTGVPCYGEDTGVPVYANDEIVADVADEEIGSEFFSPDYSEIHKPRAKYGMDVSDLYKNVEYFTVDVDGKYVTVTANMKLKGGAQDVTFELIKSGSTLKFAGDTVAYVADKQMTIGEKFVNLAMQMAKFAL